MNAQQLRAAVAALALALPFSPLAAADAATEPQAASRPGPHASDVIDEVLAMHRAGVDPGVIVGHLRALPELPRWTAADIVQLREHSVSPDVMSALILMSTPDKARLSADDIVQMHQSGVPSDIISAMITKTRKTTETAARTAAQAAPKTNQTFLLAMPRRSSVIIIPHRPYYYSPHYRGNYYGERYYGPTLSYGFGYPYHYGRRFCW